MAPIQLRGGLARRRGHAGPSAAGAANAAVVLGRGPGEIWRVVGESGGAYSTHPGAVGKVPLPDGRIVPRCKRPGLVIRITTAPSNGSHGRAQSRATARARAHPPSLGA